MAWMESLGQPKSPYPEGSKEDHEYHLQILVPILVFIIKIALNITFQNTYQGSFTEKKVFPFYKRSTAIGYCQFVARALTIMSPLIAEVDRPIPLIVFLCLKGVSFIAIFFLPNTKEKEAKESDDMQEMENVKKND